MHARNFLEGIIWSTGRHCPHCGSIGNSALSGRTCRPGSSSAETAGSSYGHHAHPDARH
ncbi:MAG: transposase [Sulfitobacter sp.]|nr:transposase [Sulfitobacter sp. LC.270.F.C4]WOI17272.1 transposase [Sulfitobacter sp. LC.270.F.C4]